jgi:hypothetical protein
MIEILLGFSLLLHLFWFIILYCHQKILMGIVGYDKKEN